MRTILVLGQKRFRLRIQEGAKVTFGPWGAGGTLFIHDSGGDCIAAFAGVDGYRDLSAIPLELKRPKKK